MDSGDSFEEDYDFAILGFGVTESVLASALSKAGKKVIHISPENHYGGATCSLNFVDFINEILNSDSKLFSHVEIGIGSFEPLNKSTILAENQASKARSNEKIGLDNNKNPKTNDLLSQIFRKLELNDDFLVDTLVDKYYDIIDSIVSKNNKYCIELLPKLIRCRGDMISLLIDSNLGQFIEFLGLEGNYIISKSICTKVPDTKQVIFSDPLLSLKSRFSLSKFIKFIETCTLNNSLEDSVSEYPTFKSLLNEKFKIFGREFDAISFSICGILNPESHSSLDGCNSFVKYVSSIGKYGSMAYLYPLYGCGSELSQSFCRSAAVAGAIYIMGTEITEISKGDKLKINIGNSHVANVDSIISSHMHKNLISNSTQFQKESCNDNQEDSGNALDVNISRATGISDLDKDTLFSAYFCINDTYSNQSNEINSDINRNILFVNDRCNELDFDNNIIDAKEMFEKLCPGVGFMST
ncbi:Rab GDP-dissociation inhibitor [Smittium culicis]|uniref:Rab GDP-dissociation inhibitor n=1 Tax=Smittium culicis TaxID=133412 RepID=A0A1R1XTM5_9FUNG|nr:Rab GDP-dissociation inhibitor [Smittium culicis]